MWIIKLATLCECHGLTHFKQIYEFHGNYISSLHYFSVSDLKNLTRLKTALCGDKILIVITRCQID